MEATTTTPPEIKPLNFTLVLCQSKKKFDKYVKINKIRNKYIVDITKMIEESGIEREDVSSSDVLKIQILKKFKMAIEKKKDIYYLPDFKNSDTKYNKLFNIKALLEETHNFNLLYFYEDFEPGQQPTDILTNVQLFDFTQILKDY